MPSAGPATVVSAKHETDDKLENLFTQEEENFFQRSLDNFCRNWRAISQGSEVMGIYSKFCQNPRPLSPRFMSLLTGHLRSAHGSSFSLLSSASLTSFSLQREASLLHGLHRGDGGAQPGEAVFPPQKIAARGHGDG